MLSRRLKPLRRARSSAAILIEEMRFQSPMQNFPLLGLRISFEKLGLIAPKNPTCDS
jgi:hypothetical protein